MENELLAFEVRFLKAQLAESERSIPQLKDQLAKAESSIARLEETEKDLVLLLRRLANSPFGWYFGLKQNFRALERRYLNTDA